MTARRLIRHVFGLFYGPYVLWRTTRPSQARVQGKPLFTAPGVFHPSYFLSTGVLIDSLGDLDLRGKRFLDMGTGSGPIAVSAAARGALVTACDINPRAVALAAQNLRRNQLRGEVLESDLFSALADTQFDVICFNIPFYRGQPADHFEAAFFGGPNLETVATFAAGCGRHLASAGVVVIVYSEDSDHDRILSLFDQAGLEAVVERVRRKFFEEFHVVRFRHRQAIDAAR